MHTEIVDEPLRLTLLGYGGAIDGDGVGPTGKRHMDKLWQEVRRHAIKTKGINHWVYLPNSMLFTGIELADPTEGHGSLDKLEVSVDRHLRYLHVGHYAELPQIWQLLVAQLQQRNEIQKYPHLEIYGHWNPDPSKCETAIVIGLNQKS